MDDPVRKAAEAAWLHTDCLARAAAAGFSDPVGESLRRSIEGYSATSEAMKLAFAGLTVHDLSAIKSNLDLASINNALAGVDIPRISDLTRDLALMPAVDRLNIAGIHPSLTADAFRSAAASAVSGFDVAAYRLPEMGEFKRLAELASSGPLASLGYGVDPTGLEAAMGAIQSPWLRYAGLLGSAQGFGELQAMGALLKQARPFADEVSKALRLDLGDWRDEIAMPIARLSDASVRSGFYLERGLNPTLTDFTPRAFDESLSAAGLIDRPISSDEEDEEEADLARAREVFDVLQRFEREVRRFVERTMHEAFGERWVVQRIPSDMRDRWIAKRDIAVKKGEVEGQLIDYADFTDYKIIIDRNDNWQTVFRHVFGRQEDVRESFQRLFPVRICTMHSRKVTSDDQLYLAAETRRLLSAIRKKPS